MSAPGPCDTVNAAARRAPLHSFFGVLGSKELAHHAANIISSETVRARRSAGLFFGSLAPRHTSRPGRARVQAVAVPRARLEHRVAVIGRTTDALARQVTEMEQEIADKEAKRCQVASSSAHRRVPLPLPARPALGPIGVPLPAPVSDDIF